MEDLQQLLIDSPAQAVICPATGLTKNDVLLAITNGADATDKLKQKLNFCAKEGKSCSEGNKSGHSCEEKIEALFDFYGPLFKIMCSAKCSHGHSHKLIDKTKA